jgi:hypothetical protein
MKTIVPVLLLLSSMLMSCENPIRMETKVHADGSLEKEITIKRGSKSNEVQNIFGVSQKRGWQVNLVLDSVHKDSAQHANRVMSKSEIDTVVTFSKKFPSVQAANQELDTPVDTLFHVHSEFKKRFRWFYTYIEYRETFRPINRFKQINPKDYFNLEDSLFIQRLPGEGATISKADSLFLDNLNTKMSEVYLQDALFAEYFSILETVIRKNTTDSKWLDTLASNKEAIYREMENWDGETLFAAKLAAKVGIPLPEESSNRDFAALSKDINSRVDFMSAAQNGQYINRIEMPWTVMTSNADSIAGNALYWRPMSIKFATQPYTMFAVSRQLNLWAVVLSLVVIGLSVFIWLRPRAHS